MAPDRMSWTPLSSFWLVLSSFSQARQGAWERSCVRHAGVEGGGCWWGGQKLGLPLRRGSLELSGSIYLSVGGRHHLAVLLERGLSLLSVTSACSPCGVMQGPVTGSWSLWALCDLGFHKAGHNFKCFLYQVLQGLEGLTSAQAGLMAQFGVTTRLELPKAKAACVTATEGAGLQAENSVWCWGWCL